MLTERFGNLFQFLADHPKDHARDSSFDDMPLSYKEGGAFISAKQVMPW